MSTALLLVDIQNDYFPDGAMSLVNSVEAGKNAGLLLEKFRSKQLPIIHIQHVSLHQGATFFLPNTHGVEIHNCVQPTDHEPIFVKHYPNSFRETGLLQYTKDHDIRHFVIAGMMTHMCIDTTTRAGFDLGFTFTLAHDACATKNLTLHGQTTPAEQVHHAFVAALDYIFAQAQSTEKICLDLN